MGRRELLLALAIAAAVLLALHLLRQPAVQPAEIPAPAGQPEQPAQAPEQPAEQPEEQPHVEEQPPRPSLIVARIEAGEGGRVLVNGSEAAEWSSYEPFTLVLEAVPESAWRSAAGR